MFDKNEFLSLYEKIKKYEKKRMTPNNFDSAKRDKEYYINLQNQYNGILAKCTIKKWKI